MLNSNDIFREAKLDYWRGDEEPEWESLVNLKLLTRNTRLVDARKAKGVTQLEMSKTIEMSLSKLSRIENLKFVPPDADKAKIAAYLVQPIDYLFPDILMKAIEEGVFSHRDAQLAEPEIISLTEAQRLRLTYDGESEIIDQLERKLLSTQIDEVLETLSPREQKVIRLRFGFEGRSLLLAEVGEKFHVTRERIRQIETKALRKLRHPAQSRKLVDYLD